jgi:hypothetical protein
LVVPKSWPEVFAAIRTSRWQAAAAGIEALPASPLKSLARAQLFTAKGSPPVSAAQLLALLAEAPELPQAEQLGRMAQSRGATVLPATPRRAALVPIGTTPRRGRARAISGEPEADRLRTDLDPLVKADDGPGAEALLLERAPWLSAEARAEHGQRVAWIYYTNNRDADARRVADQWRQGARVSPAFRRPAIIGPPGPRWCAAARPPSSPCFVPQRVTRRPSTG